MSRTKLAIQSMLTRGEANRNNQERPQHGLFMPCERLRAIAYSMDALIPGFYLWFGSLKIRLGGSEAKDTYSGTIHSFAGVALILPGYRIFSIYQGAMTLDKHALQGIPQISTKTLLADEFEQLRHEHLGQSAEQVFEHVFHRVVAPQT